MTASFELTTSPGQPVGAVTVVQVAEQADVLLALTCEDGATCSGTVNVGCSFVPLDCGASDCELNGNIPLTLNTAAGGAKTFVNDLLNTSECLFGADGGAAPIGKGTEHGAFFAPRLLRSNDPHADGGAHDIEAFGPVSTLMGYGDLDEAVELGRRVGALRPAAGFGERLSALDHRAYEHEDEQAEHGARHEPIDGIHDKHF